MTDNEIRKKKELLQMKRCQLEGVPYFVPSTNYCSRCHNNIYDVYDFDQVSNNVITGCTCGKSFID